MIYLLNEHLTIYFFIQKQQIIHIYILLSGGNTVIPRDRYIFSALILIFITSRLQEKMTENPPDKLLHWLSFSMALL